MWTLTELGEMVLERQDSCFSTAVFCSTIVFMGEILFYLQKPKNSQELLKIAEEYHLNWKTNSEIHNRIKWFRDVDMVRFEEYKLEYSLTQKGQEFLQQIEITMPSETEEEPDETILEEKLPMSEWASALKPSTTEKKRMAIGYMPGKTADACITISAYLQLMNQAISIEEIREYSKINYQIAVSSSNMFLSFLEKIGFVDRISKNMYVTSELGNTWLEKQSPDHEIGILYRLQNQSALLEQVLTRNGIPVHVAVKEKMRDIPVVQWFFHVLRFCVNHSDTTSGVEALCNKTYGEGWTTKKALRQIRRWETDGTLPKNSPLFSGMVNVQEDVFVTEETDQLWEMFSLDRYLMPSRAGYQEDKACILGIFDAIRNKGNIREFLNDVALYGLPWMHNSGNQKTENIVTGNYVTEKQSIEDLTAKYPINTAGYSAKGQKDSSREEEIDAVQLMTLHASKGLEFTCVFIIGVNDGLLPLRGTSFDQEEEERRLFFVGMTRAKEQLELSYYTSPDGYGILPGPGKYLKMFPKDLIEGLDEPKYAEGSAAEHLQAMKRQILQAREERTLQMPEEDFRTISPEIDVEKPDTDPCRHEEKEENPAKSATNHTDADSVANQPRVAHEKYGVGTVISENEDTITIRFDDYGEKELLKMFTVLHPL